MNLRTSNSSEDQAAVFCGQCGNASEKAIWDATAGLDNLDGPVVTRVNTCGGNVFCPEGKQDSLDLGLKLEERLHNIYLPAKLCIAVSGCDNQCAEACAKDIGIVGMEDGWDLFVGRNGCRDIRHAWQLAKGLSTERVLEVVDRIVALFRADCNDKKKLSALIEGIGFESFKAKVLRQKEPANK
ncbi:MAG: hypothetical protein FVQ82_04455 [Planctomycetes bacterium]|nr:hypothetical protein [Planctomycetota bacterium]